MPSRNKAHADWMDSVVCRLQRAGKTNQDDPSTERLYHGSLLETGGQSTDDDTHGCRVSVLVQASRGEQEHQGVEDRRCNHQHVQASVTPNTRDDVVIGDGIKDQLAITYDGNKEQQLVW